MYKGKYSFLLNSLGGLMVACLQWGRFWVPCLGGLMVAFLMGEIMGSMPWWSHGSLPPVGEIWVPCLGGLMVAFLVGEIMGSMPWCPVQVRVSKE